MVAFLSAAIVFSNCAQAQEDVEMVVITKQKLSQDEVQQALDQAASLVEVGGVYFHHSHSDNHYKVLHVALCKDSLAPVVVYQALYGAQGVWVRSLAQWLETVEVDGQAVPRFQKFVETEVVADAVVTQEVTE